MTDQGTGHVTITLAEKAQGELDLVRAFRWARERLSRGKRMVLEIRTESRTLAQNRLMWSVLRDLSNQVLWWGKRLTAEGWKDFLTAHLSGHLWRTALLIQARNLYTGRSVWVSSRLPTDPAQRAVVLVEARSALTARLVRAGVL